MQYFQKQQGILYLLIGLTFCFSCETPSEPKKPTSGGLIDEVMIIVDEENLRQAFSDTLIHYFMPYFKALPQPEPRFNIKIKSFAQFENAGTLLKKYRNLVFAGGLDESSQVGRLIRKSIGEDMVQKSRTDSSAFIAIGKDIYAKPQQVIYLFAPSEEELVNRLGTHHEHVLQLISDFEYEKIAAGLYIKGTHKEITKLINQKQGLNLKIPFDYMLMEDDTGFTWVAKTIIFRDKNENILKEVQQNFMMQSFHLDSADYLSINIPAADTLQVISYPIALRDTMAWYHIKGREPHISMVSDMRWPVYQQAIQVGKLEILETRGLWFLSNPFRGGPYLNYSFIDQASNKLFIIDAFIYAAGSDKRKYMREMETILQSLSLVQVSGT